MTSAQVGKSTCLENILGYFIVHDPCPILLMQPNLDDAAAFSKDRVSPMIRDTHCLTFRVKAPRARDSGNTQLHKKFSGGSITFAGANAPSKLAGRPIRILMCDEVDRYPFSAGTEGDPVSLATRRTNNFPNRKSILTSTPTVKGESRIERIFESSDQRRFHVECPNCHHWQTFKFPQLKWENNDPKSVWYHCEDCDHAFDESKKLSLLRSGKWIPTKKFKGIAGFHLNELYSPWRRWHEIVEHFLEAKDNPQTLKVFINTVLGESWEEKGDAPEWKNIYDRREDYPIGSIPKGVLFLTAGVDIQQDRIEVEVVGWKETKESYSIDHYIFTGNPNTQGPWKELDALMTRQWALHNGITIGITLMAVDSQYLSNIVYNWCKKYPPNRVIPIRSKPNQFVLAEQSKKVDSKMMGRVGRTKVWNLASDTIKSELYSLLRLEKPLDGEAFPPGYCHFPMYHDEYFKQLTAEKQVPKVVKGFVIYEWKRFYRNEVLDMRVYARAAAHLVGLDRFERVNWNQLKSELHLDIEEPLKPTSRRSHFNI
jgi:phage terminase large subunit GpA-like protein